MSTNLSGKQLDPDRLSTSYVPLLIVLVISSMIGVAIAGFISMMYVGATTSYFFVSYAIAKVSVITTFALMLVPLWGLVVGSIVAGYANNGMRERLNVQLLPDSDPIASKVQILAHSLGLPPVKYIGCYEGEEINAFAAGTAKDEAMIAFTKGAVEKLSREQFDAVMAHEIGHIVNNDMLRMTYARGFQESLTFFLLFQGLKKMARWMLTTLSEIGIMALSRSREYRADAIASVMVGSDAMVGALEAIAQDQARPPRDQRSLANLMFRANPSTLFATHPTVGERINAIETKRYISQLPLRSKQSISQKETVTQPLPQEAFVAQ